MPYDVGTSSPRVLIIVQNLPVPMDRRVWLECQALRDDGYEVSVICPLGDGDPAYELLDGVHVYKYPPCPPAAGFAGYVYEFFMCWLRTARLSWRVRREVGFDVIQACNPPDTYFALAVIYKVLARVRFVYDQHDLSPEVFLARFGEPRGLAGRLQYAGLQWLERMTYRVADQVISTNESYRAVALDRGRLAAEDVTVVRSGPDTRKMRPVYARNDLKQGRRFLAVYLGIMGPQDGVDVLLRVAHQLVHVEGRRDVTFALLGFGDCLDELRELCSELHLDDFVTFTGRADADMVVEYLSAADVGLCPDPLNALNDLSTMNKTMEYMAHALPVVAFDLKETHVTAGHAAVLVPPNDEKAFAAAVSELLDDVDARVAMALAGRKRAAEALDWAPQRSAYLGVYNRLLGRAGEAPAEAAWPDVDRRRSAAAPRLLIDGDGRLLVDLRGDGDLEDFLRQRDDSGVEVA